MQGMWLATARLQQQFVLSFTRACLQPWWLGPLSGAHWAHQAQRAHRGVWSVLSQGLAPIERKASSNARRLARSR